MVLRAVSRAVALAQQCREVGWSPSRRGMLRGKGKRQESALGNETIRSLSRKEHGRNAPSPSFATGIVYGKEKLDAVAGGQPPGLLRLDRLDPINGTSRGKIKVKRVFVKPRRQQRSHRCPCTGAPREAGLAAYLEERRGRGSNNRTREALPNEKIILDCGEITEQYGFLYGFRYPVVFKDSDAQQTPQARSLAGEADAAGPTPERIDWFTVRPAVIV
ncbi:hypothetical protein NM208_g9204 [Fusarium decemcellulare]|uniref:Uncharacterized protein n=1 Tax=Fusarium decemcellulare TaxID=57161 RepID=A0ACC1S2J0_9HYPO|nr:hypothetical protein NM208_g9204 [Fusarium decemcellulare]